MSKVLIRSNQSHPEQAAEVIVNVKKKYGLVPSLPGVLSESPVAAEAYLSLGDALRGSQFTPNDRRVVWFTINTLHNCHYCLAAHMRIAKGDEVPRDVIEMARAGGDSADRNLRALRAFTTKMVLERSWAQPFDIKALFAAGYSHRTVLDVILAILLKVLSNYTSHMAARCRLTSSRDAMTGWPSANTS